MSHPPAQYGQDTGNPAATFHEVRVWKEEHEPEVNHSSRFAWEHRASSFNR